METRPESEWLFMNGAAICFEVLSVSGLLGASLWCAAGEGSVSNGFIDVEFNLVVQSFMGCALWVLANTTR